MKLTLKEDRNPLLIQGHHPKVMGAVAAAVAAINIKRPPSN